jgi:CheY-like chemotaxis protein
MMNILVVDDDILILDLIAEVLQDQGFTVVTATDGRQALSLVERAPPDGIVTDLMIPHLDGATLCQRVKTNPLTHAIIVILISASHRLEREARRCPADAILPKPFDLDDLVDLVKQHLDGAASTAD